MQWSLGAGSGGKPRGIGVSPRSAWGLAAARSISGCSGMEAGPIGWRLCPGGCTEHWRGQQRGGRAPQLEHLPQWLCGALARAVARRPGPSAGASAAVALRGPLAYSGGASPGSVNMKVFL